jgi:hypothetical protein
VLDAASGAMLDKMPTDGKSTALVNDQTDRLYLVTNDGLVQCMHELGADLPFYHNPPEETPPVPGADVAPVTPPPVERPAPVTPPQPVPAADTNPFGDAAARDPVSNPFGVPPAGGGAPTGGDNPFDR